MENHQQVVSRSVEMVWYLHQNHVMIMEQVDATLPAMEKIQGFHVLEVQALLPQFVILFVMTEYCFGMSNVMQDRTLDAKAIAQELLRDLHVKQKLQEFQQVFVKRFVEIH